MSFLKYAIRAAKRGSNNYFNQPRIKGFLAERDVLVELKDEKHVFHDIQIDGKHKTQIDHILINQKGIIVIETKNYGGIVMGKEHSQHWTHVIYGNKKFFYNPIKQNQYHIKVLKEFLPENHPTIHSIIVFSSKSELILEVETPVVRIAELRHYIDTLPDEMYSNHSIEDIAYMIKQLKDGTNGLL